MPYLRVMGLEIDTDGTGKGTRNFTAEEEEEFGQMARGENFYERFSNSIAPSIFGNNGESCHTHEDTGSTKLTHLYCLRYQESHRLFIVWWFKESVTRWNEVTW